MGLGLMDIVESGDYRGREIKLKGLTNKPTLIAKGFLGKTEIRLDKSSVAEYNVLSTQNSVGSTVYRSEIKFKNGKKCNVLIQSLVHNAIMKALG